MGQYIPFKNYAVCQICGRVEFMTIAKPRKSGWLVSPRRYDESVIVVRCPYHISEWSLRESKAGRTQFWRKQMAKGKALAEKNALFPPYLSPFPMTDELPEGMVPPVEVSPSLQRRVKRVQGPDKKKQT